MPKYPLIHNSFEITVNLDFADCAVEIQRNPDENRPKPMSEEK